LEVVAEDAAAGDLAAGRLALLDGALEACREAVPRADPQHLDATPGGAVGAGPFPVVGLLEADDLDAGLARDRLGAHEPPRHQRSAGFGGVPALVHGES